MGSRWTIERGAPGYPATLEELDVPPEAIHGIGDPEVLLGPCISIVGARRATPYGISVAEMAGRVAAECGVTVVSGGALGCDHAALRSAIDAGGRVAIISGCGADVVYPRSSTDVFEEAPETGGAVVSMEPWGRGPRRYSFPKRNQLIAAVSKALIVTEAGSTSGTMGTAEAAVQLSRLVYAIPGSIFSPNSSGTNRLAAEGARIIPDESSLELSIALDYGVARFASHAALAPTGRVMSAIVASPARPDDLSARLNIDVITLLRTLTDYETRGIVTRLPDGRYSPSREFLLGQNRE